MSFFDFRNREESQNIFLPMAGFPACSSFTAFPIIVTFSTTLVLPTARVFSITVVLPTVRV